MQTSLKSKSYLYSCLNKWCHHILCLISVSINASTNSIKPGENFSIDCYVFGLSVVEYLNSDIELLLRKNNSIIQTVRVLKGGSHGENDKYGWTEKFHKNNTCEIISVRFDVFSKFFKLDINFQKCICVKKPFFNRPRCYWNSFVFIFSST